MNNDDPIDDIQLHMPQDDLDADDAAVDPVIIEENDDPTEVLGVSPTEFKNELDKYDIDEAGHGDDDMLNEIEDRDEDDDMGNV